MWKKVKVINNWGRLEYFIGDMPFPSDIKTVTICWPDGRKQRKNIHKRMYTETISEQGHYPETVYSNRFVVVVKIRGVSVDVDLKGLKINVSRWS